MNNEIIIICGFTGSGKDTISKELEKQGYNFIISTSTRPMRKDEKEGNPYFFTTNKEFETMITNNEFIEYRKYNTIQNNKNAVWYYGVHKNQIQKNKKYVVVLDPQGTLDFKSTYKDRCKVFFIDVDNEERKKRAIKRGSFEEAEFERRLLDDRKRFTKKFINDIADYVIENYNFNNCINQISEILKIKE